MLANIYIYIYIYIPQTFLCQNFIPTNGVSLLSYKFKNRSTESQKISKNKKNKKLEEKALICIYIKVYFKM